MNSAERVKLALNHEEPDSVPIDLGGIVTGISRKAQENLKDHLGLSGKDYIIDKIQQLAKPHPEILKRYEIDTRYVFLSSEEYDPAAQEEFFIDDWGVKRQHSENHAGGEYYDIVESPLEDKSFAEIKKDDWIPEVSGVEDAIRKTREVAEGSSQAIILNYMGAGFEFAWYLRGFEKFLMDLHENEKLACYIIDKINEQHKEFYHQVLPEIDRHVDILMVGDDLGTQIGPMISPALYRRLIKPRQKELYRYIKDRADVKLFYHSCGDCLALIPDLIEIGVDILNPIQISAMDPEKLKKEFGQDLVFWGGIDTHEVLPFGTAEEVEEEVKRIIDILAPGGGFVFNSVHNIQADVPPENIEAMFQTAREYGRY